MQTTAENSGKQSGDPLKAADAMIEITEADHPPRHLVLGAWGVDAVDKHLLELRKEFEAWRTMGAATDYDAA